MECTTLMYPERQAKLARGEIALCFIGAVTYQDFFDIWHRYWFSYRRDQQGEWLPYRNHRDVGAPTDWFGDQVASVAAVERPPG
jgi:hypothetical protein